MLEYFHSKQVFGIALCFVIGVFSLESHVDASALKSTDSYEKSPWESSDKTYGSSFKCPDFGHFPHPDDCSKYYKCSFFNKREESCPEDHLFDGEKKKCKPEGEVNCGSRKRPIVKSFTCPSSDGAFPHPGDCSKYYKCTSFIPSLKACPEYQLFDGVKKQCKHDEEVNCGSRKRPIEEPFKCPGFGGYFPHPRNCSKFYACFFFSPREESCPEDHLFDAEKKQCKPEGEENCGSRKKPIVKSFTCPSFNGAFPHPDDCSKYYQCTTFNPSLKACPENQLFDGVQKQCKLDWEVHCGSRKRPIEKPFQCPKLEGYFPNSRDCLKFYKCTFFFPKEGSCDEDHLFDSEKKKCLPEGEVNCGSRKRPIVKSFTCPSFDGAFPHPDDCSKYYQCTSFNPSLKACPENQLFDGVQKQCKHDWKVNCGSRKRPIEKPFQCQRFSGFFPHPRDCSKYYKCTFFFNKLESCPEDHLFDSEKKKCLPEGEVNCGSRIRPIGKTTIGTTQIATSPEPTTPQPTTTPPTTPQPTSTQPTTLQPTTTPPTSPKPTGPPETDCDENDLDCIIKETGDITKWFECPEAMGSFRHPRSKRLFIFCKNWKPFVKKCGQVSVYSEAMRTCIAP